MASTPRSPLAALRDLDSHEQAYVQGKQGTIPDDQLAEDIRQYRAINASNRRADQLEPSTDSVASDPVPEPTSMSASNGTELPVASGTPPSLETFLEQARPLNPTMSDAQITSEYNHRFGQPAKSGMPDFAQFLKAAKPLNPDYTDAQIKDEWDARYGSLGAREHTPGFGEAFVSGMRQGKEELGASGMGTIERLQKPGDPLKQFAADAGARLAQAAKEFAPPDELATQPWYDRLRNPEYLGNLLGNQLVQSAPTMVGAVAGGLVGGAPGAAAGITAVSYFQQAGQTYRDAYQRYTKDGLTDTEAHEKAYADSGLGGVVAGIVNALAVPASLLSPFTSTLKNLALKYVANVAVDTGDQATQNVIAKATYNPEQELTAGIPEAVVGSAVMGAPESIASINASVGKTPAPAPVAEPPAVPPAAPPAIKDVITPILGAQSVDAAIAQASLDTPPIQAASLDAFIADQAQDATSRVDASTVAAEKQTSQQHLEELFGVMHEGRDEDSYLTRDSQGLALYKGERLEAVHPSELPESLPGDERLDRQKYDALNAVAQVLGKNLVLFKANAVVPDGVTYQSQYPTTIFLSDQTSASDLYSVFTHEATHLMEGTAFHDALRRAVWEQLTPESKALAIERHGKLSSDNALLDEVTADVAGHELHKPEVWEQVFTKLSDKVGQAQAKAETLTFIDTLRAMIAKVKTLITSRHWGTNPDGKTMVERQLKDLTAVHDALTTAVANVIYQTRYKTAAEASDSGKLALSKRVSTDREIVHPDAVNAFESIATAQRGAPEAAMLDVQRAAGGGVLSPVVEHVGDLIHRMTEMSRHGMSQKETLLSKIDQSIRSLTHAYGFDTEHQENLKNNAKAFETPVDTVRADVDQAMKTYAAAHQKLPVYNLPQWLARAAAVAVGKKYYTDAARYLTELKTLVSGKDFSKQAFHFDRDAKGNLQPYLRPLPAKLLGIQRSGTPKIPDFTLYNIEQDIPGHPTDSSVAEETLKEEGFRPVPTDLISQADAVAIRREKKEAAEHVTEPAKKVVTTSEKVVKPAPPILIADLHDLADERGIPWDNDRKFEDFTERTTGKRHLDDLTPEERTLMAEALRKTPKVKVEKAAEEPRFSPRIWFSQLGNTLNEKMPKVASKEQVMNILASGSVKQDEIKWTGIQVYLDAHTGPIQKAELLDWLATNDVRVDETLLSAGSREKEIERLNREYEPRIREAYTHYAPLRDEYREATKSQSIPELRTVEQRLLQDPTSVRELKAQYSLFNEYSDEHFNTMVKNDVYALATTGTTKYVDLSYFEDQAGRPFVTDDELDSITNAAQQWGDSIRSKYSSTEFQELSRRHGEADRAYRKITDELIDARRHVNQTVGTQFQDYTLPGGKNYHELLLKLPIKNIASNFTTKINVEETDYHDGAEYRDIFDAHGNIRATLPADEVADYIRTEDRYTKNDRSFLEGHYQEPDVLAHVRFNDRTVDGKSVLFLEEVQSDWHQKGKKEGYRILNPSQKDAKAYFGISDENWGKMGADQRQAYVEELNQGIQTGDRAYPKGTIPDAPFKTTWHELVMKRILRWAAEHNYDRLAWTTGEQQASRYDLSTHVQSISYAVNGDGEYMLSMIDRRGDVIDLPQDVPANTLDDHVGKDVADKMRQGAGEPSGLDDGYKVLSGLDLKVGGEGMKGFYDRMLPMFMNKYVKKWGTKVETIRLPEPGEQFVDLESGTSLNPPGPPVHSVNVTPEMKESVINKGQPLFTRRLTDTVAFKMWFGKSKVVNSDGTPKVVYHGTEAGGFTIFNTPSFFTAEKAEAAAYASMTDVDTLPSISYVHEHGSPPIPKTFNPFTDYIPTYQDVDVPNKIFVDDGSGRLFFWDGGYNPVGDKNIRIVRDIVARNDRPVQETTVDNKGIDPSAIAAKQNIKAVYLSIQNPIEVPWDQANRLGFRLGATSQDRTDHIALWKSQGYDGLVTESDDARLLQGRSVKQYVPFLPEQIKSATDNRGAFDPKNADIMFAPRKPNPNTTPGLVPLVPAPPPYPIEPPGRLDKFIRIVQDRTIDIKRVVEALQKAGRAVPDDLNPVFAEEMWQTRAAQRSKDASTDELLPLTKEMALNNISIQQLDEALHARHVLDDNLNARLEALNPDLAPNNTALSGITDAEARAILAKTNPAIMNPLMDRVDRIVEKTRDLMVTYGLETQVTIDEWRNTFQSYVPLRREGFDDEGHPTGTGHSLRGSTVRQRGGSNLAVENVLANVMQARDQIITRGERQRPTIALAGLLMMNPNPDLATLDKPAAITYTDPATGLTSTVPGNLAKYHVPTIRRFDPRTGVMRTYPDPTYKGRDNVVNFRVNGIDYAIVFNEESVRAVEVAKALKNLDTAQLNWAMQAIAPYTRYLAAINTQYNPIFGIVNFVRDVQFAALSLGSTVLAGKQSEVLGNTRSALSGIYQDARDVRAGIHPTSPTAQLWERFQHVGGPTGYRDLFFTATDRAAEIQRMLDPKSWSGVRGPQALGKRIEETALFKWLSDYNVTMENAIRLAVFKTGVDHGLSDIHAASLAKNITVNFNKKGQIGSMMGSLYAFFNANVQGTARIAETVFERTPTGTQLTSLGKKIVVGGLLVGVLQTFALTMAGFDDDDPPEFVKQKNIIIPVPGTDKGYVMFPMPLGFNLIPNVGRLAAEAVKNGIQGRPVEPIKKAFDLLSTIYSALSPTGGSGGIVQELSPTITDPLVGIATNTDWTGRSISKEDHSTLDPTPGHTRAHDTATPWARGLSKAINWATGGTDYTPGVLSPTPDAIDYLIQQATGGAGREISKAAQVAGGAVTGESVPVHKIPLAGRFIGTATGASSVRTRFYDNVREANIAYNEFEGRATHHESFDEYVKSHPEARFKTAAIVVQKDVALLQKEKRMLIQQGATSDAVKLQEERITTLMKRFNDLVTTAQKSGS